MLGIQVIVKGGEIMKKAMIAALLGGQLLSAAHPALAADPVGRDTPLMGAFAGVRLRMPLGDRGQQRLRAGLTIAPTMQVRSSDGAARTRFGEGLELGLAPNRPLELSLAGTRLDRFGVQPDGNAPGGRRAGVSTLGWVAIGVGATILVAAGAGYLWLEDALDCDPGNDCS